ncbi:tetratricopeptide repeat protein [Catellatospora vulcania]|uniref:tetratricopeptide repeat protein n=1 Tax=Catellatospora vulcania TaxID=1460450 RepID=UPI0012D38246|nr:tetratricopeptide repeat protein [Catellatospora vulcania]
MTENAHAPALMRAHALLSADRPEEALRELAALPASEAVSAIVFELRAAALLQLERWSEASEAARSGLAAGGPDPDLLCQLGLAEYRLGRHETAERALLDGLALAPEDVSLLCVYTRLCLEHGQLDKARRLVDLAAAQDPDSPTVYSTRVQLAHASGDDVLAQRISRAFVAAHPENAQAHALLGGTSAARGQVRSAYSGLRQAVANDPGDRDYAQAAYEARIAMHPLLVPLRPFARFGPVKTWIAAIVVIYGLRSLGLSTLATVAAVAWFALCVYSWVVPPLLRKWMMRRWR